MESNVGWNGNLKLISIDMDPQQDLGYRPNKQQKDHWLPVTSVTCNICPDSKLEKKTNPISRFFDPNSISLSKIGHLGLGTLVIL